MSSKSALLRTCSAGVKVGTEPASPKRPIDRARRRGHLLLVGNCEALAPLGAAALQPLPAVLGRHPDQEAVRLRSAAGIRLKRALALLRSSHFSPPPSRRSRSCETTPQPGRKNQAKTGRSNLQL